MKTLLETYSEHSGKVSDKWNIYFDVYEKIFAPYRDKAISLLEVGIQNGGSLEIWAQYFPQAKKIIGCDINPACSQLTYSEENIQVVVGDANNSQVQKSILDTTKSFDVVIDDGSHTSSDIIKTFFNYFPHINNGGIFIAEDLCCSYWSDYEGGIYHPYSSINFFKLLVDIVNFEHWGVAGAQREDLLRRFQKHLGVEVSMDALREIHSVEFVNSMCIIRKAEASENVLGKRLIVGEDMIIGKEHLQNASGEFLAIPDQSGNEWSEIAAFAENTPEKKGGSGSEASKAPSLRECVKNMWSILFGSR
jgi:hypothetical protein